MMTSHKIRLACLRPAGDGWEQPTGEEVREVLKMSGLSGSQAASFLGLGSTGSRTVRRWAGAETPIPYAAWALLCEQAGLGMIWKAS